MAEIVATGYETRSRHSLARSLKFSPLQSLASRWRRAYKTLFPWVNISFEVVLLAYNVAYLFERTPFYRPWLAWVGVDLRRLGAEDFVSGLALFHNRRSDRIPIAYEQC